MLHTQLYQWQGRLLLRHSGSSQFAIHPGTSPLLSRNENVLRAASIILFGEHPTPDQVIESLETTWLPLGTKVRYVH